MARDIPVKKLLKTALYSSVILVGALALTPYAIFFKPIYSEEFLKALFFLGLSMIFFWGINISIVYFYNGYKRYLLSYAICTGVIFAIKPYIDAFAHHSEIAPAHFHAVLILTLFLNTIVLVIGDLVLLRQKKSTMEIENAGLKLKNAEATNQQLKQQIHPHFLFNSLSTLKTLIKKDPEGAEDYLVKLSDFLRASLLSATPNTVRLAEELKLCNNYLEMQKMRFGNALQYMISIPAEVSETVSVPVFSLLVLLENAIKHNKLTQEEPLHIKVDFAEGWIITSNNLQARASSAASMGLGLGNLAERYRILSGDEVKIINDGKTFSVSIKTLPDEDSDHRR
jgi:two-component system, LytTR family, sensor kinase